MIRLIFIAVFIIWTWHPKELHTQETIKFKDLLELGIENLKSAKYEKAVSYFKQAIAVDPKNGNGYFQLAFGLHQLNKFQKALSAYQSGFELIPDYYYSAEAYYNMTVAADKLRYGVEAIKYLKKSLQAYTDRSDYGAVYKIGKCLKELSDKYPEPAIKRK